MSPMETLKKLFGDHFHVNENGEYCWGYLEGVTLNEVDPVLLDSVKHLLSLENREDPV